MFGAEGGPKQPFGLIEQSIIAYERVLQQLSGIQTPDKLEKLPKLSRVSVPELPKNATTWRFEFEDVVLGESIDPSQRATISAPSIEVYVSTFTTNLGRWTVVARDQAALTQHVAEVSQPRSGSTIADSAALRPLLSAPQIAGGYAMTDFASFSKLLLDAESTETLPEDIKKLLAKTFASRPNQGTSPVLYRIYKQDGPPHSIGLEYIYSQPTLVDLAVLVDWARRPDVSPHLKRWMDNLETDTDDASDESED